jgi:hypothetical protein
MWRRITVDDKEYALVPTTLFIHHEDYELEWGSPCHLCPHFVFNPQTKHSNCAYLIRPLIKDFSDAPCHADNRLVDKRSAVFVPLRLAVELRLGGAP